MGNKPRLIARAERIMTEYDSWDEKRSIMYDSDAKANERLSVAAEGMVVHAKMLGCFVLMIPAVAIEVAQDYIDNRKSRS